MNSEMSPPRNSPPAEAGWRKANSVPSLEEVNSTVPVPKHYGFWRKLLAFSGPGYLVAVGYMDPGNWATDIQGGAAFGYTLLSIVLISNLLAILLQSLCLKLGIVTGRDLAQACRDHYSKPVAVILWFLCEIAICACDIAEVLGSAIGLNLLFGIPLSIGVVITAADVMLIFFLQNKGFRWIEALVITLILTIGGCFFAEIIFSKPNWAQVAAGFMPTAEILRNKEMLLLGIGILGATVMPHNLYLHSSIVQTRKYERTEEGKREAIKFATIDSTVALMFALFINAAILIMAAATFHSRGQFEVTELQQAHEMLSPLLGVGIASTLFAVALLASGQNSTLTGTLAGQIVMEGFLNWRIRPWLRRLITRLVAIVPALIATWIYGDKGATQLLVWTQVILSLQLSFAVIPLILFTSDPAKMGKFANPLWLKILAWLGAALIVVLNIKFVLDFCGITGAGK